VRVTVRDERAYGALLLGGSVGLGASYVAGWWDSDDLIGLVRALFRWSEGLRRHLDAVGHALATVDPRRARLPKSPRAEDRRSVCQHYDLSNEFFALMLDETMTYSCGIFESPHISLQEAQLVKIDRLCTKLRLQPGDHLVEIGTGWGALALHAAAHFGSRVTTTTVSAVQRAHVEQQVREAGLCDRITVLGEDWRHLDGTFDKLVSVEMIEAVDWRLHERFLQACSDLLAVDGLAALQAIVIDDRSFERAKHHQDFIRRMVFPGSSIPSRASLMRAVTRTGNLQVVDVEEIGCHYAETLRRWARNLEDHDDQLQALGPSTELRRLWSLYLAYCSAGYLEGYLGDVQLLLSKRSWNTRRDTTDHDGPGEHSQAS
jgi:cyclopropane-fatty-acyl-phospholipid synthase